MERYDKRIRKFGVPFTRLKGFVSCAKTCYPFFFQDVSEIKRMMYM